ncbi:MAG: hypothetical protein QOJ52_1678 [Acidimicrobiaceae bacterium]|jgi:cell division septum initiation protein DivIVA|nr:hypothetical protein [Acidimicrobiaceae bacterium]MDQ1419716.1 hypothetical protein [Acidimicrobiaceae bacterium]MDQ1442022.1 hypothetical protein [Acidimicrobiaceae bacterium]
MTTELAPQFAVTVRGYDRPQVDDYVDTLREWLGNATLRMEEAESENAHLREQVALLRNRLGQVDQHLNDSPPRSMQALGDRVTRILQLAEEGAIAVQADADAEAVAVIGRARQEAADLIATAQTRQADMEAFIAGAADQATVLVQQAEARATESANRLLAESEAQAAGREAQAAERGQAVVAEAEAQRGRILTQLREEQEAMRAELHRLEAERDEMRDGLTRLRESLHRTIAELPGGAPPPPSAPPSSGPQAQPPAEPS